MSPAHKDIRWRQRFQNFEKSWLLLEQALDIVAPSEIERAGLIQYFEITFELAWKLLKDYLQEQGYILNSPRETLKQAFQSKFNPASPGTCHTGAGRYPRTAKQPLDCQILDPGLRRGDTLSQYALSKYKFLSDELIDQGHTWIEALADRNLTTHTYDDETAALIEKKIREDYSPLLKSLYHRFREKIAS